MIKILQGNCLEVLKDLPEQSVNTCITSPPYWQLRDYQEKEQLGLEDTPEEFVENLVNVFREVKRVLRDDGTVWLNLGDSYVGGGGGNYNKTGVSQAGGQHITNVKNRKDFIKKSGLKPKDLVGIPWRVAFGLQKDRWFLRQDIIWHKPVTMPESVTDRCTKSHEYIFLLSKKAKYYFDNEAIKEDSKTSTVKRNKRSVWSVNTKPFKGAHFATFPPDLIRPCVLAGCPEGGTVLDPFGGAGTTGLVAEQNNRDSILIELNADYIEIAKERLNNDAPLFNEVIT